MAYVRVHETDLINPIKSITAIPDHYVVLPAKILASAATTDGDGRKVVKAGTAVSNALTVDGRKSLTVADGSTGKTTYNGVIVNDAYVAEGETAVNVAVLVHGFIRKAAVNVSSSGTLTCNNDLIVEM